MSVTLHVDNPLNFVSPTNERGNEGVLLVGVLRLGGNVEPICGTICIEQHDNADTALHAEVAASGRPEYCH